MEFISLIFLLGVLILILPSFLNRNYNLKIFIQNISIWIVIIFIIILIINFFNII